MKKRDMLFASVLVIGMGMTVPAWAEEAPAGSGEGIGGFLSSLLSDDGTVSDLLGEDGAIGSLLGNREAMETISGLFQEDGALAGILPEDVDVSGVLDTLGSQLEDAGSTLNQGIQQIAEMAADEYGSVDWEKLGGSAEELIGLLAEGLPLGEAKEDESEEDLDAYLAELLIPYEKAEDAMFEYVGERNAAFMDTGDVQVFSKTTGYIDDLELDEIRVLGDFTQINFTVDGDHMNVISGATDTLLLTLQKNEDGSFTVTGEKSCEDGEAYNESLEALCEEVGIPVDDFYVGNVLGAYNDATALADYLEEHPEIATAEYQGEQKTAEELRKMSSDYTDSLFDSLFEDAEEMTEEATE